MTAQLVMSITVPSGPGLAGTGAVVAAVRQRLAAGPAPMALS
jgi:hypothetical protein